MAGRPQDTDAPWRSAAAQVVVDDLSAPGLGADDAHHLGRVLRLRPGAQVCATDGQGGWRLTTFAGGDRLDPAGEIQEQQRQEPMLTVAFAPVKGDRPELVVQKLTEVGVDRIVPLVAARSVVRWDGDRAAKQMERLRRVAQEACGQCRRLWLPEVGIGGEGPVTPAALLSSLGADGAVMAEPGGGVLDAGARTVLVGPEGGWSPEELADADAGGAGRCTLGPHVLRAETAAIVAGALLVTLRASG
jgi:16S rRNA (uracil1498-N3)-methyltransferase